MTKPETIRERAKSVQPDMSHDLITAPFHHHRNCAVTVHLGDALLSATYVLSTTRIVPDQKGFSADAANQRLKPREQSGIVGNVDKCSEHLADLGSHQDGLEVPVDVLEVECEFGRRT